MTSSFVRRLNVKSSILEISQPNNNGTDMRHHALICVYCSSGVNFDGHFSAEFHPTTPTIIISRSFQCPGLAYGAHLSCVKILLFKLFQLSFIAPPVLHVFETSDSTFIVAKGVLFDKL